MSKRLKLKKEKILLNNKCLINDLPNELLEIIFSKIHKSEHNHLKTVCKKWFKLIKKNTLIERISDKPLVIKANNFKFIKDLCYCRKNDYLMIIDNSFIKTYKSLKLIKSIKFIGNHGVVSQNMNYFFVMINKQGLTLKIDKRNLKIINKFYLPRHYRLFIVNDNYLIFIMHDYFYGATMFKFNTIGKKISKVKINKPDAITIGPDKKIYYATYIFDKAVVIKYQYKHNQEFTVKKRILDIIYYDTHNLFITNNNDSVILYDKWFYVKSEILNFSQYDIEYLFLNKQKEIYFTTYINNNKIIVGCNSEDNAPSLDKKFETENNKFFFDKYGKLVFLDNNKPQFLVY